jgi:isopentenyl-diphosphate delta-isomerase
VETLRARKKKDKLHYKLGKAFWDWGIPTALSVVEARSVTSKTLIATGGVRSGLDAAKLLALGADVVGMALPFLKAANKGEKEVEALVKAFYEELKTAMFLTGCHTLSDLKKIPIVITGYSQEWLMQRGIELEMPWRQYQEKQSTQESRNKMNQN